MSITETTLGIVAAIVTVSTAVISIALTGGKLRFGPFEIVKGKDVLDQQIDEIASIVKEQQNHESKSNTEISLTKISDHLTNFASLSGSPLAYDAIIQAFSELKQQLVKDKREDPTWSLVEGLINNYHKQALRQASIQFWFSIIAAVVGFGFVINELAFVPSTSATEKVIGTIPGIVIDLVAALFFKQAEQTRQRATDLYDRLRTDNERTVAIKLIDSIENENLRSIVKAQLALKIGGVDSNITDLSTLTVSKQD